MPIRPTSRLANRVRTHATAKRQRARIVACLRTFVSLTREDLERITRIKGNSLRPRVRELLRSRSLRIVDGYGTTKAGNKAELLALSLGAAQ